MYSDAGPECTCAAEPSGCQVEARLVRDGTVLSAADPVAVPARLILLTGPTGNDGHVALELAGCGADAEIDLPRSLDVTASFTVTSSAGDAVLEWSSDSPVDRIQVACFRPFVGYICGRAPNGPASIPEMLCDGSDANTSWAMRLLDSARGTDTRLGYIETWRSATAQWDRN